MVVFIFFVVILFLYSLFSYILTDPNLVLSSAPVYWNFQKTMWQYYSNPQFITNAYVFLLFSLFFGYFLLVYKLKKNKIQIKSLFFSKFFYYYLLLLVPLLVSMNALSHDIFNYLFNAKMVVVYATNPHIQTALHFVHMDDWLRFMHNTHTTAPYGYGWTALSLLPFIAGMQKLLPALFAFRVFTVLGLILLYFGLEHVSITIQKRKLYVYELALLFLNPLFLIETVSNYHNDIWMLIPTVFSLSFSLRMFQVSTKNPKKKLGLFAISLLLLMVSISIKLVTVVLVPIYLIIFMLAFFIEKYAQLIQLRFRLPIPTILISQGLVFIAKCIEKYIPVVVAVFLFIPLFTARSQQFHPWYLLWILVWIPLIKQKSIRNILIVFSISSLLRYVPWLHNGFNYSDEILRNQKLITWGIPIVYIFTNLKNFPKKINKSNSDFKKIC